MNMKKNYKKIVILMAITSLVLVVSGCILFSNTCVSVSFVVLGTIIALLSKEVVDKYGD